MEDKSVQCDIIDGNNKHEMHTKYVIPHAVNKSKLKLYLEKQIKEFENDLKIKKKKYLKHKIMYYLIITGSVTVGAIITFLAIFSPLTPIAITIGALGLSSSVLTGISSKLNIKKNKEKIKLDIKEMNKLKNTLDYIISLNGNITTDEQDKLLKELLHY